nr:MAG TPA: hypothetical protein [Caudoviricetes sp.]
MPNLGTPESGRLAQRYPRGVWVLLEPGGCSGLRVAGALCVK